MSALDQKQTLPKARAMSALPPKADIERVRLECPLCARSGHWRNDVRAKKKDRLATVSLKSISKFNQAARVAWWPTLGPANINLAARLLSKSARGHRRALSCL